jgi:hypothetical protein
VLEECLRGPVTSCLLLQLHTINDTRLLMRQYFLPNNVQMHQLSTVNRQTTVRLIKLTGRACKVGRTALSAPPAVCAGHILSPCGDSSRACHPMASPRLKNRVVAGTPCPALEHLLAVPAGSAELGGRARARPKSAEEWVRLNSYESEVVRVRVDTQRFFSQPVSQPSSQPKRRF